ncbi:MAG: type IV pilus assembly protein PilM [Thermodesulfobacteriota bacterium]
MFSSRDNLVGVDVGAHSIKIVRLGGGKGKRKKYSLKNASCVKIPEGVTESSGIIADTIKEQRLRGCRVATFVGGSSVVFRHLNLPEMPPKDLKEAVRWELRKDVDFAASELVADYVNTGKTVDGKLSLIAFAVEKNAVERTMATFKKASLDVRVVDVLPTALLASFDMNNEWETGVNYAMLDVGTFQSTLVVMKDGHLRFVRDLPYGGDAMTLAVANGLDESEQEAEADKRAQGLGEAEDGKDARVKNILTDYIEGLGSEITRSFDYYHAQFREGAVEKLFLSGGTAALKGLDHYLSELTGTPCYVDDPLRNVEIPSGFDLEGLGTIAPYLSVAAGLATRKDAL